MHKSPSSAPQQERVLSGRGTVPKSSSCPGVAHEAPLVVTALPEPCDADGHPSPSCFFLCPKVSLCHLATPPVPCLTPHRHRYQGSSGQKCCSDPEFLPKFLNDGKSVDLMKVTDHLKQSFVVPQSNSCTFETHESVVERKAHHVRAPDPLKLCP